MSQNNIKKPKIYLYTSFPSAFFWIFIQAFTIYEARNDGLLFIIPIVFFTPFVFLFIYISLLQINWKIEFENENVIYRNWVRKEKIMAFADLEVIYQSPKKKGTPKFYLFYKGKKITTISMYDENIELLSKLKTQKVNGK